MATRRTVGTNGNINYSSALMSSAIQDHLIRTLDLSIPIRFPSHSLVPSRPIHQRPIRSVIDTGLRKKKQPVPVPPPPPPPPKTAIDEDREYVIRDVHPSTSSHHQQPTLAERIGLITMTIDDDQHLSEAGWNAVKQRSNARQDSNAPCAICKEEFGLDQQVLLSCSHVFHHTCLTTFEKFVTHNQITHQRSCPMCRRAQYEKRIIYEGAKVHRAKCAARIQAAWRGYIVRQWYKRLHHDMALIPQDNRLRRRFYQEKLSEITDRIVASCDFDLNDLFAEIDRNVEQARALRRAFDARTRIIDEQEWTMIEERTRQRDEQECSICKCSLRPILPTVVIPKKSKKPVMNKNKLEKLFGPSKQIETKSTAVVEEQQQQQPKRPLVLLSCTHVFHATCLQMFEEFSCDPLPSCPVCRAAYQKNTFFS